MAVYRRRLKDALVGGCMLFLALLIVAKLQNTEAERFAEPFFVVDGDTLAKDGVRLRLQGLDAPETLQICQDRGSQPYDCGAEARLALGRLLQAEDWSCSGLDHDRYNRLLVLCRAGDQDLGHRLVALGWAVADGNYLDAEGQARAKRLGLWEGSFQRPVEWRHLQALEPAEPGTGFKALMPDWLVAWFGS